MIILPHTLSLITTHHCTAACDHCCFSCSPKVTVRIPSEKISDLINEAAEIPTMKLVCFTGGECFTLGKELDGHIAHATGLGLVTRCITNGYWAITLEHAKRRIEKVAICGLKEINFSTGSFHQKFVPIERILYGTLAASEQNIFVVINMEICDQSDEEKNNIILKNEKIIDLQAQGKILIQRNVWIEAEGKTELSHPNSRSRFHPENKNGCRTVMNVLTVSPTLDLIACCGLHLEKIDELHLGSLKKSSLHSLLKETKDDLLKIWIHLDGPEEVLIQAKKINPNIKLPLNSTHPCETCLSLYKNTEAIDAIRKVTIEREKDIMDRYMRKISLQIFEKNISLVL